MPNRFEVAVIGKGLMGSAVARHLALSNTSTVLIGPDEPTSKADHQGVFGSHYDEGRITRSLDPDPNWALFAKRSIERYESIREASGISFFADVGAIMAGRPTESGTAFIDKSESVGHAHGVSFDVLDDYAANTRFPYLDFSTRVRVLHEASGAGYVSPRRLVSAQTKVSESLGTSIIRQEVTSLHEHKNGVTISYGNGETVDANRVVVAAGGFSSFRDLLPSPIPMRVYARTIVFFELTEERAHAFRGMPSIVSDTLENGCDPYILPPILYPDGKYYLKLGGDPNDVELSSEADIKDWFRSDGNPEVRDFLVEAAHIVIPEIGPVSTSTGTCVTSFTRSGFPIIEQMSDRVVVVTGGCGKGAKSSDELGRLGALTALGKDINNEGYNVEFSS